MNTFTKTLSFAALALLASSLTAQSRNASWSLPYGNSSIGGRVTLSAYANTAVSLFQASVTAGANAAARVRVAGADLEAASIDASYRVTATMAGTSGSTNFRVRLAGFTVFNSSNADVGASLPSMNVFGPTGLQFPIPVGPVALTVTVNAGVTSSFSLDGTVDLGRMMVGVTGSVRAAATGTARLGLGVPGVSAGVTATLNFADTTFALTLGASRTGPTGSITISVRPIRLFLGVYAEIFPLPVFEAIFYEYSMAAQSRTIPLV